MPVPTLSSCHCCGLTQVLPPAVGGGVVRCARCRTPFHHGNPARNDLSAAFAFAAMAFYLPAMLLPMLRIEKLGHLHEDNLIHGVVGMLSSGYLFVGLLVLGFSVVLPAMKLVTILLLHFRVMRNHERKAFAYRAVEFLGKWGMMDVMLVAILVAFVKLGDLVEIQAGSGIVAFAVMVLLSLISGILFDPHVMWEEETPHA